MANKKRPAKNPKSRSLLEAAEAAGINKEKVDELLEKISLAAADKSVDPQALFKDFVSDAENFRGDTMEGLATAFFDIWNAVAADKGSEKGPLEETLINGALRDAVMDAVKPFDIADEFERQVKVGEFTDKWLQTSQPALKGMTPNQVILKERESRGNTQKEVSYTLSFDSLITEEAGKKYDVLYIEAMELLKTQKYTKAIKKFHDCLEIFDGNHAAWYNLAKSYISTGNEEACLACLKKSIAIKPDYEFAVKGLKNLEQYAGKGVKTEAGKILKGLNR